jgi:hypothetical protein
MSVQGSDESIGPWRSADPTFARLPGIDPDLEWAVGSGISNFVARGARPRWIPVVVELRGLAAAEFAAGSFIEDGPSRTMWQLSVRVSPLSRDEQANAQGVVFCAAMVTLGFFEFLRRGDKLPEFIVGMTLSLPLGQESLGPDLPPANSEAGKHD